MPFEDYTGPNQAIDQSSYRDVAVHQHRGVRGSIAVSHSSTHVSAFFGWSITQPAVDNKVHAWPDRSPVAETPVEKLCLAPSPTQTARHQTYLR